MSIHNLHVANPNMRERNPSPPMVCVSQARFTRCGQESDLARQVEKGVRPVWTRNIEELLDYRATAREHLDDSRELSSFPSEAVMHVQKACKKATRWNHTE